MLRQRIREMAQTRVRYGYRKIRVLLNREGWAVGKKLVYRLYREEGLMLRHRVPRRRKSVAPRWTRPKPGRPNEAWTLDVVADQLANGHRFRALTVVDVFTRERVAMEVGQSLRGEHVVTVLNWLTARPGAPTVLFCDSGSEFCSQILSAHSAHQLLETREADRQCPRGIVQCDVATGVSQCALVRVTARSTRAD